MHIGGAISRWARDRSDNVRACLIVPGRVLDTIRNKERRKLSRPIIKILGLIGKLNKESFQLGRLCLAPADIVSRSAAVWPY